MLVESPYTARSNSSNPRSVTIREFRCGLCLGISPILMLCPLGTGGLLNAPLQDIFTLKMCSLVFGPVHSRRLGLSLGINNVPYKHCSYSCVYCQLGATTKLTIKRRRFCSVGELVEAVTDALRREVDVDYVSFVPDGEPTLDADLKLKIRMIRERTSKPVAVLTNASLLWMESVRDSLNEADLVSIKIDAAAEEPWRRVNRPHRSLRLDEVIDGIIRFSDSYSGELITETTLVRGLNDSLWNIEALSGVVAEVKPKAVYIMPPVRPPAEPWVKPPSEEDLAVAHGVISKSVKCEVRLLSSLEPPPPSIDDPLRYLLATLSVHPLEFSYAVELLRRTLSDPLATLKDLEGRGLIRMVDYEGRRFIVLGRASLHRLQ
ncbi:MAG: radical SAM protein [Candidatus Nezhaarchaeota archaeon]|nr:radical SAM protein [Candidatus Nezhaarchaeota archaeon]